MSLDPFATQTYMASSFTDLLFSKSRTLNRQAMRQSRDGEEIVAAKEGYYECYLIISYVQNFT